MYSSGGAVCERWARSTRLARKLPGSAPGGLLHQLAVHHHQGLGDGPLEARALVRLVVGEGEHELAEPSVAAGRCRSPAALCAEVAVSSESKSCSGVMRLQAMWLKSVSSFSLSGVWSRW